MSNRVLKVLQRVLQNRKNSDFTVDGYTGFLFLTRNGTPKMCSSYDAMFRKLVGKYNKNHEEALPAVTTPHTLRHTLCTNMANAGMNPKAYSILYILDLILCERDRLCPGAHKIGDSRCIANDVPGPVIDDHFYQRVTGKNLLFRQLLTTVFDLDIIFHGHDNVENFIFHPHRADFALKIGLDFILIPGICMDNIPFLFCFHHRERRCAPHLPDAYRKMSVNNLVNIVSQAQIKAQTMTTATATTAVSQ